MIVNRKKHTTIKQAINQKERSLKSLEIEEDTASELKKLDDNIKVLMTSRVQTTIQIKDIMKQMFTIAKEQDSIFMQRIQVSAKRDQTLKDEMEMRAKLNNLRAERDISHDEFEKARVESAQMKKEAEEKAPLTEELKQRFTEIPGDTIEEIDEAISDAKKKADLQFHTNPRVIEEYEQRKIQIEKLEVEIKEKQTNLDNRKTTIETLKSKWLPPLKNLIIRINISFSKFFADIGCAGEVSLLEHPTDFDKYGIEIRVRFREDDTLHTLNAHLQSGGERSVSTILYLIALQDLTHCPFRLVDEINQGMDPRNERMVFHQIAATACRPGLPQYFMITPKLLPDLEFTKDMKVLCVYNGPWQEPQSKWKVNL